jgi:hypothetical protein
VHDCLDARAIGTDHLFGISHGQRQQDTNTCEDKEADVGTIADRVCLGVKVGAKGHSRAHDTAKVEDGPDDADKTALLRLSAAVKVSIAACA